MDEQEQVVNEEVKENTQVESTTPEKPAEVSSDSGADVKQTEEKPTAIPYERFREINEKYRSTDEKAKALEEELQRYKQQEAEKKLQGMQSQPDPYANLSPEEKAIKEYEDVKATVQNLKKAYETQTFNTQVNEAKDFCGKVGLNFEEKLPEVVDYLSRPENRGRLTATEAVLNLYRDNIIDHAKKSGLEEIQKEKDALMAKKKAANMPTNSVAHGNVVQSDTMAREGMTPQERLTKDINDAIEMARRNEKSPKVRTGTGDNLYKY